MVPAPMFTSSPIVASPRYVRWLAFDRAPSVVFLSSTKLPMYAAAFTSFPGRRCANGPMIVSSASVDSVTMQ